MAKKKARKRMTNAEYTEELNAWADAIDVPVEELGAFMSHDFDVRGIENQEVLRDMVMVSMAFGGAVGFENKARTPWQEANVLVAAALRNNEILEDLHAGRHEEINEDPGVSRLSNREMRALMIFTARRLAFLLAMRDTLPTLYRAYVARYLRLEPGRWVDNEKDAAAFVRFTTDEECYKHYKTPPMERKDDERPRIKPDPE